MPEMPKQVVIKGDVSGQIAVGNYIIQFRDLNGCNITINPPEEHPNWERCGAPTKIKPRPPRIFLDRTSEIGLIERAIQADQPMTLSGVPGIGKTTLLKQLAHLLPIDRFRDGIYCCSAYNLKLDDLLQCLFSAFYESRVAIKPDRAQIQIALQDIQALILLDDLMLSKDEIQVILDIAPKCVFVISSTSQTLQSESEAIRLGGLPDNDAMTLFEQELGRSLAEGEHQLACEICHLLKGHPENICWIAAKIREEGVSLEEIVAKLKGNQPETLFLETVQSLPEIEKQILSILAVIDGRTLPQEHFDAILSSVETRQAFKNLGALNIVESHSPAYSLSESFSGVLAQSWGLSAWEEVVIKYFVKWVEQKPSNQLIENIHEALLVLIKKAGKRKNWPWVISLGRALEPIYILRGYWQAWNDILHLILEAARALGNHSVEGWALHQMGSRSLCLGGKEQAEALLRQAASVRRSIGDQAGLELTQHNLSVLAGAPPIGVGVKPAIPTHTLLYAVVGIGAVAVAGLGLLAGLFFYRPAPPVLMQPPNNDIEETNTRPDFKWKNVWRGATYQIQVDGQPDFSSPEFDLTATTTTQTPSLSLRQGVYYWRVRAISDFNRAGNWSQIWKFTISIPPGKPTLTQPVDKFLETKPEALEFVWEKVDNSTYYLIQIDDNNDFGSPVYENKISANNLSPSILLPQGDYYWRVRAYNIYNTPGEWSSIWQFMVSTPPLVPTLTHPSDNYVETSTTIPKFEWSETENGETYQIQVDNNQDFSSPEFDSRDLGTSRAPNIPLAQAEYFWRVRAFNKYDTPSEWSKSWKITISIPPAPPDLISPTHGFLMATTVTPSFAWNGVQNAVSYHIQVDNNPEFSSLEYESKAVSTSHTSVIKLTQGDYFWRVRALNRYGTAGEWSKTWKFTISIPPAIPTLSSPSDNAKLETTNRPTFTWQSASNAVQYQIQVDNSNAFDSPLQDNTSASLSFTPSLTFSQGLYSWRVRGINSYNTAGQWSPIWQFVISVPPGRTNLKEPKDKAFVNVGTPSFQWQNAINAAKYQLQVDNNPSFSSPEFSSTTSSTNWTSANPLSQGLYYWRVRALNAYDTSGDWSLTWEFTISIPPPPPELVEPSDAAIVPTKPTLSWKSVANAVKYEVEVDDVYTFDSIPSLEYEITTSGTSTTVSSGLLEGKHWWRVRALNNYGTSGEWSISRKFYVSIPPDTAPVLYSPVNYAYVNTSQPTFIWYGVAHAYGYQIQIDDVSNFSSPEADKTTTATQIQILSGLVPSGYRPEGVYFYTYYWRVRAYSSYGASGPWSSVWVVTLKVNVVN